MVLGCDNVELQDEITDLITNRHVPRRGRYDNILIAIRKNPTNKQDKTDPHPYYVIRCQKKRQGKQISKLNVKYPDMVIIGSCEDPNAVHQWCWFKEDILDDNDYYRNHFSVGEAEKEEFFDLFGIRL